MPTGERLTCGFCGLLTQVGANVNVSVYERHLKLQKCNRNSLPTAMCQCPFCPLSLNREEMIAHLQNTRVHRRQYELTRPRRTANLTIPASPMPGPDGAANDDDSLNIDYFERGVEDVDYRALPPPEHNGEVEPARQESPTEPRDLENIFVQLGNRGGIAKMRLLHLCLVDCITGNVYRKFCQILRDQQGDRPSLQCQQDLKNFLNWGKTVMQSCLPVTEVDDPHFEIAVIRPVEIITFWLADCRILESLSGFQRSAVVPYLRDGSRPNPQYLCNCWDGTAFFQALERSRVHWQDGYQALEGTGTIPIFMSVGHFFDHFTNANGTRTRKQGILSLELLNLPEDRRVDSEVMVPMALFQKRKSGTNIETSGPDAVYRALAENFLALSRGVDFALGTIRYRIFVLTSEVKGDLPALQEMLGLKISSNSTYPCTECFIKRGSQLSTGGTPRCNFLCEEQHHAAEPKTQEGFQNAYGNLGDPDTLLRYSVKRRPIFIGLPGFSVVDGLALDMMHLAFLGDAKRHLKRMVAKFLRRKSAEEKARLFEKLSRAFGKTMKLNKVNGFHSFRNLDELNKLKAHETMKFIIWSPVVFHIARWRFRDGNSPDFALWMSRVAVVKLLSSHTLRSVDVEELARRSEMVVRDCCTRYAGYCTLKTHLHMHLLSQVRRFGPPRRTWSFRAEGQIGKLKRHNRNTNYRRMPKRTLERYSMVLGIKLLFKSQNLDIDDGPQTSIPGLYGSLRKGIFARSTIDSNLFYCIESITRDGSRSSVNCRTACIQTSHNNMRKYCRVEGFDQSQVIVIQPQNLWSIEMAPSTLDNRAIYYEVFDPHKRNNVN